ncbi:MAG TPA: hypothetical protein VKG63_04180 [Steroidobacteraceae bacterium]|nr:hypothetical protein [Steroidobacteraceae bacterium]
MIPRKIWPWMLLAACWAGPSPAVEPFELFTESEAAQWTTAPKEPTDFSTRDLADDHGAPTCHSTPDNDADNPQIRILTPTLGKTLTPPLDLDLLFTPTASAPIRPDTFRLCYLGSVAIDLTKRITDRVTVSEKGLRVSGVRLPHGTHRLVLLIADQRGRLGRREAVFNID